MKYEELIDGLVRGVTPVDKAMAIALVDMARSLNRLSNYPDWVGALMGASAEADPAAVLSIIKDEILSDKMGV